MVMRHIGDKEQFYIKPPSHALSREPKLLFSGDEKEYGGIHRGAKDETRMRQ